MCRHFAKWRRWWWTSCRREYDGKLLDSERCGTELATWKIKEVTGNKKSALRVCIRYKKAWESKWSWTSEAVEILLKYIKEFKTKCEFNGVDFEADVSTIYAEIRRCMAMDFPEDFGRDFRNREKNLKIWTARNTNFVEKSWNSRRGKSETTTKESFW